MAAVSGGGESGADGGSSGEEDAGGSAGESRYRAACRACGVTPASSLLRRTVGPVLSLRHRGLGPRGAKALALSLMVDTSILMLDLSDNWLQGEGAAAIAEMLKENCYISGEILGTAIAENIGLKELKISWNHFHSQAAAALAKGLGANIYLKVLDVSYNGFGNSGAAALGQALKANNVLEELNVSNNRISVEGALHIAGGLKENKSLKRLNMTRNPMQSEGCCGVLKALQANSGTGLEILDLPDIPVNKELAELCDAVKILFPNLLLRYGGNMKLQRKSQLKAELRTQPKVVGNSQNAVA
ncbi:leucine-rich repeat-containing protein 74B isoform X7 [Harpia harpyja]|uniref:leucine-rich repeat-containing protein 74B isoform X7 n=1 Tax=Harpia harpyja TaxID=202280 RepID=UPI0022B15018|nr:leucine-rich repeat-containing protein 74B isoform X7 [Harpia harpyja]